MIYLLWPAILLCKIKEYFMPKYPVKITNLLLLNKKGLG